MLGIQKFVICSGPRKWEKLVFDNILKRFECLKLTSFRRRLQTSKERMEAMQMTKRLIRVHGPESQVRRKYVSTYLPSSTRIKRPRWRPVELSDRHLRSYGKKGDCEQSNTIISYILV